MLIYILFFILLIFSVLLESVIFPYPIVFITLSIFFLFKNDLLFFFLALFFGVLLDTLAFQSIGATPLFLAIFLIFIYIFERVFVTLDVRLFMVFVFLFTEAYRFYVGYPFQPVISITLFLGLMISGIMMSRMKAKPQTI